MKTTAAAITNVHSLRPGAIIGVTSTGMAVELVSDRAQRIAAEIAQVEREIDDALKARAEAASRWGAEAFEARVAAERAFMDAGRRRTALRREAASI